MRTSERGARVASDIKSGPASCELRGRGRPTEEVIVAENTSSGSRKGNPQKKQGRAWGDRFDKSFAALVESEDRCWSDGSANLCARFGSESPVAGAAEVLTESMLAKLFTPMEEQFGACGSPIEEAMLMALLTVGLQAGDGACVGNLRIGDEMAPDTLHIFPQFKVDRFRVDFQVELVCRHGFGEDDVDRFAVLVECDGHDYHERTKDQAKRDKARDRKLQAAGHTVLHFTGSEIWADPLAPAIEVYDYLAAEAAKRWEREKSEGESF